MDPKIRSLGRTHDNLQAKSNSPEIKSTNKNPLEKHRMESKTQVANNGGDVSTKNVKSEVASKFNEKFNSKNSNNKPPPPKYPAPPPPFSIVGAPLNQPSLPPGASLATDLGKPPPHPTTPPPDFPIARAIGEFIPSNCRYKNLSPGQTIDNYHWRSKNPVPRNFKNK